MADKRAFNPVAALANSRVGPALGLTIARTVPYRYARRLARWLADRAAARSGSRLVRAVRANQAVVRGLPYGEPRLDDAVCAVLRQAAHSHLVLFRAVARGAGALKEAGCLAPEFEATIRGAMASGRGVLVAGAHMGSFDVAMLTLGERGLPAQVLAYHNPEGSYKALNAIRLRFGLDLTPISLAALRKAHRRLSQGGLVVTGVDRPDPSGEDLEFFGRRALMPAGYARLALQAGALVLPAACLRKGDYGYQVVGGPPIEPPQIADSRQGARMLAQEVLKQLERIIAEHPSQWLMFFPVWPESLPQALP